jgi:hypothetical protein
MANLGETDARVEFIERTLTPDGSDRDVTANYEKPEAMVPSQWNSFARFPRPFI